MQACVSDFLLLTAGGLCYTVGKARRHNWLPSKTCASMKKTIISAPCLVMTLLMTLICGCSDHSEPKSPGRPSGEAPTIEPGVSIGKVHTNMTVEQVVAELGEPDNRTGQVLNYVRDGFSVIPNTRGIVGVVMCGDSEGINGPLVQAFKGRTKEGIGMNSLRQEVIQAYGEPTKIETSEQGHEILRFKPIGLTFTLQDGRVHHMIIDFRKPK